MSLYQKMLSAALPLVAACASWIENDSGLKRVEYPWFGEKKEFYVCDKPQHPEMPGGDDPVSSALKINNQQWYQKAQQQFGECKEKALDGKYPISGPEAVSLDNKETLNQQEKYLEKREDKKQAEKYAALLEETNKDLRKGLLQGHIEFKPKVTVNPVVDVDSGTEVNHASYASPAGSWVETETRERYLPSDVLESIRDDGQAAGYNVEHLGNVTFAECEVHPLPPSSSGMDTLVGKLRNQAVSGKTIVLRGNADARSAGKCFSGNNEDLSGHRAVSVLNDLYARLGDGFLKQVHADIVSGGAAKNERSVDISLVSKE